MERLSRSHLAAAIIGGELVIAELPGVGVVGVAAWYGPGEKFLLTYAQSLKGDILLLANAIYREEQGKAGFYDLMASLKPETQAWWQTVCRHSQNIDTDTYILV